MQHPGFDEKGRLNRRSKGARLDAVVEGIVELSDGERLRLRRWVTKWVDERDGGLQCARTTPLEHPKRFDSAREAK